MIRLAPLLTFAAVLMAQQAHRLHFQDPWARPAPSGGNSALYGRLHNTQAAADTLRAAYAEVAARVELHRTVSAAGGMRRMEPVPYIALPAGSTVELVPGGLHVMLIGLKRALRAGDTVTVELEFARAGRVRLRAPVRALAPERAR
ncbi:MAG: copper chaperone PCu(A)C [Bacteroidetes bacterium]|nr:copper chaperone PCu(A)C [Rhodothermia bacterium]MCS7155461.1 copper chaperone PCu(A)C [Bacteroidota bacterium]MCX7907446.1 copper chaperone PCu(A)C [Bacteroidota bacterium]MDW8138440.1 copper chaperone PCu(A)C [Bacteroidota bacterium]MDW8284623.1 copper chaperone PCu(A)C [Bacteroidota bacterium]